MVPVLVLYRCSEVAKELGVLTVAVVTKPFSFEGSKRMQHAIAGIETLSQNVDSLIVVPNNKLLSAWQKCFFTWCFPISQ